MEEQKERHHPPVAETQEGGVVEVRGAEEAETPSLEDLDELLRESEGVAIVASMSEKEIDEMAERRQESLDRLQDVETIRESRLHRVERYNPLKDLKPSDYERLVQEEVIDKEFASRYKTTPVKLVETMTEYDKVIAKLEALEYPSADAKAELEKLSGVRNAFREKLEGQIGERQQKSATRRDEVKNKVLEHYGRRAEELERTIAKIESNPRVIERLQTMAEVERKAFEEKIQQERAKIIQEAGRYIDSLEARHQNAFARIGELLENENVGDGLVAVLSEGDERKQQSVFDSARGRLMNAIIDGEGERQLTDPREVVPWKMMTSIQYEDAMDFLRNRETESALQAAAKGGNAQAKKLLERRGQIINDNAVFRHLVGPQWVTDHKTGKRRRGVFWAAFETRKKNDKEGITAARKKEREETAKREAEFQKQAKEIVNRGGFVVEALIVKKVRGKNSVVGSEKVAVRLERKMSQKNNPYWEVAEIFGATSGESEVGGLAVGSVSPLDMRSFPAWLRESAGQYFTRQGDDFVERLRYKTGEETT